MSPALLVIDVQESFRHRPYWSEAELPAFLQKQQALIDGAEARGWPVIQIFHTDEAGPFSLASGHVRTLEGLRIEPTVVFHKSRHSALVGTGLDVWLTRHGVTELIVSGIRTEQCCETTTRHASDLGYTVAFVGKATLTFDMVDGAGRTISPAEIRLRTEMVLKDRFARIASVEEVLSVAPLAAAA